MAISLTGLQAVVAVAETGSYTLAARRLGRTQGTVSRAVDGVEAELGGVKLFVRNQAGTQITDEGRRLVEQVRPALEAIDGAVASLMR